MGPIFSLTYTRPRHVACPPSREAVVDDKTEGSIRSGTSGCSAGIPDSLAFDRIMNGGTCPPLTVRDFMNYLFYVEHAAENLQFWLWYKDYVKRFETAATADMALEPPWTQAMQDDVVARMRKDNAEKQRAEVRGTDIFKGTEFEKPPSANSFKTPPHSAHSGGHDIDSVCTLPNSTPSAVSSSYKFQAAEAFAVNRAKQPFTIQPFRDEINRVVATYIMEGSPRQLNLSSWEQKAAIQALAYTTHPTALQALFGTLDSSLRQQAHPNFVRWSICNGNPARVFFARALGVGLVVGGLILAIVLTLSRLGRGWRALTAIPLVLGISTLVAAYKGMCVVLHGMHHHHIRPWELFVQDDGESRNSHSFESFGSMNSFEDEPWIVKYEKRSMIRKIFDREVWIQEPALRKIQDTIFVQAILASVLGAGASTAIFVSMPGGKLL